MCGAPEGGGETGENSRVLWVALIKGFTEGGEVADSPGWFFVLSGVPGRKFVGSFQEGLNFVVVCSPC